MHSDLAVELFSWFLGADCLLGFFSERWYKEHINEQKTMIRPLQSEVEVHVNKQKAMNQNHLEDRASMLSTFVTARWGLLIVRLLFALSGECHAARAKSSAQIVAHGKKIIDHATDLLMIACEVDESETRCES